MVFLRFTSVTRTDMSMVTKVNCPPVAQPYIPYSCSFAAYGDRSATLKQNTVYDYGGTLTSTAIDQFSEFFYERLTMQCYTNGVVGWSRQALTAPFPVMGCWLI